MAAARRHREFVRWSPTLGDWAARLSVAGKDGHEYFMVLVKPTSGREWRDRRKQAVEALHAAVDLGLEPGEIEIVFD